MRFAKSLYAGEGIRDSFRVRWKLKHNAGQLNIYVIALAGGSDQLEIYHCAFLQQHLYRRFPPYIVGIAKGYEEAVGLTVSIIEDIFRKTGNYRIKDYFLQNGTSMGAHERI